MAKRRRSKKSRRRRDAARRPQSESSDTLAFEGKVEKALPNARFLVTCDNGMQVLAHLCGKMRRYRIRVLPGDRVNLDVSAYDPTKGRITFRQRKDRSATRAA